MKINAQTNSMNVVEEIGLDIRSITQILPEIDASGQKLMSALISAQSAIAPPVPATPDAQNLQETQGLPVDQPSEIPQETIAAAKFRIITAQGRLDISEQSAARLQQLQQINLNRLWDNFNKVLVMLENNPTVLQEINLFIQEFTRIVDQLKSVASSPRTGFLSESLI